MRNCSPLPPAAARKIVEIADGVEAVQDGRIFIEPVSIARAVALGWLWRHESGTYVITDSGAALFA